MQYEIVRVFPEAARRGLKEGDAFVPSNRESAQALMQAGLLKAVRNDGKPSKNRERLSLKPKIDSRMTGGFNSQKALSHAPHNKDAASLRKNK